ncbi:aminopeptidase P N-terminal domain-containing protein [Candidatus Gracilibacteria bacterium]|nr:aminopeptidase P N-terminal domain-containing protein [Candidatus Gracilibacteria bacterium]
MHRRNGDVNYPFRQKSHMLLLTEVESPDCILTCMKTDGICHWKIFSDPLTPHEKLWGTERMTHEEISMISGIDAIHACDELMPYLELQMDRVHSLITPQSTDNPYLEILSSYSLPFLDMATFLDPLRMIKTEAEIINMRRAISVTEKAYHVILHNLHSGMYEYEIEALIASVFRSNHMTESYPTIVASGPNACTLHYTKLERQLEEGDCVLIDFGAEFHGYAADISRVLCIGKPSSRQIQVFESIKGVKEYAESLIRPGMNKGEYEFLVREKMNEVLVQLSLIPADATKEERERLSRKYYPHSTSHFLGLDVHDVGSRETIFEEGMVITCEPGIYIPEEGIGMRLEDDILITSDGCENLSKKIPIQLC